MNPTDTSEPLNREQMLSALFANLIVQQTNMALVLLGQVPNPENGETVHDLDTAQLIIDQLEMLEVKTKGNLNKYEEALLKQSLTSLRMSFVDAVEDQSKNRAATSKSNEPAASLPSEAQAPSPSHQPPSDAPPTSPSESRAKFTKRY